VKDDIRKAIEVAPQSPLGYVQRETCACCRRNTKTLRMQALTLFRQLVIRVVAVEKGLANNAKSCALQYADEAPGVPDACFGTRWWEC
jgi:hypothetical protein